MDETVKLLRDVVKSARTGEEAVEKLMEKAENAGMVAELNKERTEYAEAREAGERALERAGSGADAPGAMSRLGMWAGLEMETFADRSAGHIAEIVIQGATMGVIEVTKALNTYDGASPEARDLASRLVVSQNEAIRRQKGFLYN